MESFLRVASQLGHSPNCQQHPPVQIQKLERVNQIADQLRQIRYSSR
jgi:hypothetical protein